MIKNIISINGNNIAWYQNKENGSPVFFVHGNSAGAEVFIEQFNDQTLSNYRFIAIDLPGCGSSFKSGDPGTDYSISSLTHTLEQFILHCKVDKYSIVAHSLGGHIVLETLDKLKGLYKLIIFGTPALGNIGANVSPFQNNATVPLLFKKDLLAEEKKLMLENLIIPSCKHASMIEQLLSQSDGQVREQLGIEAASGKLKDEVAEFKNAGCKKYILDGEKDMVINPEYIDLLKDFCTDKMIHKIPEASHYPQVENSEAFNNLLKELLDGEMREGC